ncbi:hypothetical protein [Caballeronia cordobensis]|uniref:hypothetical protein n=1 Tax=Caballeronia cordobensis TaxID=1353886 RepID=UPI00118613F2
MLAVIAVCAFTAISLQTAAIIFAVMVVVGSCLDAARLCASPSGSPIPGTRMTRGIVDALQAGVERLQTVASRSRPVENARQPGLGASNDATQQSFLVAHRWFYRLCTGRLPVK